MLPYVLPPVWCYVSASRQATVRPFSYLYFWEQQLPSSWRLEINVVSSLFYLFTVEMFTIWMLDKKHFVFSRGIMLIMMLYQHHVQLCLSQWLMGTAGWHNSHLGVNGNETASSDSLILLITAVKEQMCNLISSWLQWPWLSIYQ